MFPDSGNRGFDRPPKKVGIDSMELSVCILTHSQPELLPKCVASCFTEMERSGICGEVIVIDNASTDGSPQNVAQKFPEVRILRNEKNLGFSAANNRAIRASTGRYIPILNDDAILQEGSLDLMLRTLDADGSLGAVGPKPLNPDGSVQILYTNRGFPRVRSMLCQLIPFNHLLHKKRITRTILTDGLDMEVSRETDHVAGACMLARRSAREAVGLFDENFFFFEDADLCYQFRCAGWGAFYLPVARVTHYGSCTFGQIYKSRTSILNVRSMTYYFEKRHAGLLRSLALRIGFAIALVLRLPVAVVKLFLGRWDRLEAARSVKTSLEAARLLLFGWP